MPLTTEPPIAGLRFLCLLEHDSATSEVVNDGSYFTMADLFAPQIIARITNNSVVCLPTRTCESMSAGVMCESQQPGAG